jgi:oligopeptide transport system permease protein
MLRFLVRRLVVAIPTLFVVITVAFFMMRAAPGSPFDNDRRLPPEIKANVEKKFGMNRPLGVQYVNYLGGVLHGDFGPSLKYQDKTVLDVLRENYPVSLRLGLTAILIATVMGVSLGVLAALRQNQAADYLTVGVAIVGVTIPSFVTAPLLQLVFGSKLGILPIAG